MRDLWQGDPRKECLRNQQETAWRRHYQFYCMDCLADYLDVTVDDLNEKIEEFKDEGCKLFE